MRKQKGGPERQKVTKQESGILHLLNCLIVTFATFAYFASCFVILWFVALFNYFATFGISVILASAHFGLAVNILANFALFSAYLELPFLVYP